MSCSRSRIQLLVTAVWVAGLLGSPAFGQQRAAKSQGQTATAEAPPAPRLFEHASPTKKETAILMGEAPSAEVVEVCVHDDAFYVPVEDGLFTASVPLALNSDNTIFFTSIALSGERSAPRATVVTNDCQAPTVFIDAPAEGREVTTETVDVAGRVGDVLSGFLGLSVQVNGVEAIVDVGIGTNGTFLATKVPLALGENEIRVIATDRLGNFRKTVGTVVRTEEPTESPRMFIVRGNRQVGVATRALPEPIGIRMLKADGQPFVGKLVTFEVTRSDGVLDIDPAFEDGVCRLQVRTDDTGYAQVNWRLGGDAGCGNNRVAVRSTSIEGTVLFCASADPVEACQINIGTGSSQRGEAGAPACQPLVAWVSDTCNGVEGVPVQFRVVQGQGAVNGQDSVTVLSGPTGHASVDFTFGAPGRNVVSATFVGNPVEPVEFVMRGIPRGEGGAVTRFAGVVLDNGNRPIGGATCRLTIAGQVVGEVLSTVDGRFLFDAVTDGPGRLRVDGLTATSLGGEPIELGSFPVLEFEALVIPGADNDLGAPVLLPRLDTANRRSYSVSEPTVLEVDGVPGLKMVVEPGSMFIDGQPAPDGALMSLNQVHHDDIPMPMPDGAAPTFAWTLQPAGAVFDPPIRIEYPNMTGLPAGGIAYFLSFLHETNEFEIVATGHVTEDGSTIITDPGTGLTVAGWGCNCPPYSVTGDCEQCCEPTSTMECDIEFGCCTDVPLANDSYRYTFMFGPFPLLGIPEFAAEANGAVRRELRCCVIGGVEGHVCRAAGTGRLTGNVQGPFEIPIPLGGPLIKAVDKFICDKIDRITGGFVSCEVGANLVGTGAKIEGSLNAFRDDCEGLAGWSGRGTFSIDGVGGQATLSLTIFGETFAFTLSLTDTISGNYVAQGDSMGFVVTDSGPTLSGEITIPNPFGDDFMIPMNKQFDPFINEPFSLQLPEPLGCEEQ